MSKLYTTKVNLNRQICNLILFSILIFSSFNSYSQLIVPFTPRTSNVTPTRTVYTVKGDFSMVGNTNLTSQLYSDTSANNNAMIYVDIDNDDDTWNSSASTFIIPSQNGSTPECSNIIYAGLYWTGSAVGNLGEQYEFTTTKDGETRTFDKRNIKFKPPNAADYIEVTAADDDIYFPQPGDFSNIYSAYAEVTDLIDPADFLGEYFVADLPSAEGILPPAGYHGGWGMVVVYENSLMDWKDVTIFDGHAHVSGEIADYTFDVNGFNTAQSGDVAVKLGIMAAEGDVNISGDYFEILRQDNNTFQRLSHSTNTTNNFFNSSINVGNDGPRRPLRNNNTGLDIAMFNIDNTGNGIITNNQSSTSFRYGTTSDRFVIHNITFSVNSYVPEVTGVLTNTSINGIPNPTPIIIQPGQSALYELEIKNVGTEATNNTVVTIPLPDTVNPSNLNILFNTFYTPRSSDYSDPQYDGSVGTNGAIVWNLGTLPLPNNIDDVLAEISFELTATTDCAILGNTNNTPSITLFGSISGVGAVSTVPFDTPLIQGYSVDDICKENPIPIPIVIPIDYENFIDQDPTASNPAPINVECIDDVPAPDVTVVTDEADNQGTPVVAFVSDVSDGNTCPETITRTYSVTDICDNQILVTQTITVNDITAPTVSGTIADTTVEGCLAADATAPVNTVATLEALGLTIADNCTDDASLVVTSSDSATGTCPIVVTRTYTITDACGNDATASQTINVNDTTLPTASNPAPITVPGGPVPNPDVTVVIDEADNCTTSPIVAFVSDISDNGDCPETITRTYSITDDCGNTINVTQTILITDPILPTASNPAPINVECIDDVPAPDVTVVTDEADNQGTPVVAFVSDVSDGNTCPETITRTYSVTDICDNQILVTQTITVNDITAPTVSGTIADTTVEGCLAADATAPVNTVAALEALGLTIADNCTDDASLVVTSSDSATGTCPIVVTRTYTITDACGNDATASQTINVNDTTLPTASNPAPITVPGGPVPNPDVTVVIDEADNCTTSPIVAFVSDISDNGDCPETITRTYSITDDCGNTINVTQTILITDPILPTASNPAPINVECIDDVPAPDVTVVTDEADNQGTPVVAFVSDVSDGNTCPETITRTYSVTDICDNQILVTQTITVNDITAPTVSGTIADTTVEGCLAADATAPVNTVAALEALGLTIADNCTDDASLVVTSSDSATGTCPIVVTRTYTITDACGNDATASQTINVNDTTLPTASNPAPITVPGGPVPNPDVTVVIDEADNCTTSPIVAFVSDISDNGDCPETITRTYSITDDCGNTINVTQTILITDPILPTASNPAPINVECIDDVPAPDVTVVTDEADNQGTPVVAFVSDVSDGNTCPETITRTYSVTDICDNQILVTQTITVNDITAPTVSGTIADTTVEGCLAADATAPVNTVAALEALGLTIADNCTDDASLVVTSSDSATGTCPIVVTRTYTITDACGNDATASQTINVNDTSAPNITGIIAATNVEGCLASDAPAPLNTVAGLESLGLTINDDCTNLASLIVNSSDTSTGNCPIVVTRTYIITDTCGNFSNITQTINIQDTTPPVLSLPANQTAECSDDLTPIAFGVATATDNCDASPVITFTDATMSGACSGTFTITRTWTATDACGNVSTADQIISTSDTTAPEFVEDLPQNLTIECNSVPAPETITATDNCGIAEVTVNDTRTDGNCPNNYIITRIYTATDECGLTNTHIQTITVIDITPPVFVESLPPANLVVECDSVPMPEILTATDTCGSAVVNVADVITNGNCDNNYTIARTWTATDECGLTTTYTQIIVVQDTTPPVFVEALPTDILVECDTIPTAETITATDNCGDATVTVTDVRTDGDCPSNYIISRSWTATDECGLTTEYTQTITVQDTTAPVPTSTFDETLNVSCADVPEAPQLEFTDNCSTNVVVVFNETNSFDENILVDYEIVRTWTVRDACNNEAVYTQTLFVTLDEIITDITAQDRCFDDGIVNLNDFIGDLNTNGVWEIIEGDPAATVTGSIFDPSGLELSQTFLPQDGGIDYKFRYTTTDAGCISITDLTMNVNADCVVLPCGENDVVVSKAVTPNGDQFNEFFEVSGVELCGFQYEVKIFNRWGALIYESDNYQNDWNGKAMKSIGAANNVPNGTYYYIVILKNSGLNPITGPVYLGTK